MPNYKGHLVGGLAVYGLVLVGCIGITKPSLAIAMEWLFFTLAGALFPDIDTKSKGQKYFYLLILLFFVFLTMQKRFEIATCCSFFIITPMLVRHRGIFHNPLFIVTISLCAWAMVSSLIPRSSHRLFLDILFFIAGALSHIWLDVGTSQMIKRSFGRKKKR